MNATIKGLMFFLMSAALLPTYANKPYIRPSDALIQQKLSAIQYTVTQQKGTEPPYHNAYWNNEKQGIYVDVVTGEPLFISLDKYDSGTGWPSFTKPLEADNIIYEEDKSLFVTRVEVISKQGKSHLGHVFDDGPPPSNKRFCMNSAALEFIPVNDLHKRGYGKYLPLFKNTIQ